MDRPFSTRLGATLVDVSIREKFKPELFFDPAWLLRCQVKILIVTDSASGGFGDTAGFHLGQILHVLADDPWSHIQFRVTKAHRGNANQAGVIDMFRFDAHDLEQYSQIWLFGIDRGGTAITGPELRALTRFMNAGGGVFATGDHEDLGLSLAGEVPRVRSMRRWHFPNPGPNGEPVAPIQTATAALPQFVQHDTQVGGGTQTDTVPQEIAPRMFTRTRRSGILRQVARFPHPVLCGRDGVIRHLPDHMHEGWVEEPADQGKSWTFDGETFVEYPTHNGHKEKPLVIATADNVLSTRDFGVLGAYDGHKSNVGRVVVDATWHHWFNINALPYINASNPMHPTYNPETVEKWRQIKEYYRNVAVWLARPALQGCIRNHGLLWVLADTDVFITVRDLRRVPVHSAYFWQLGQFGRDALGRFASQCQWVRWSIDILYPLDFPFRIDPWLIDPRIDKLRDTPEGFDLEQFETVAFGAAIHAAAQEFRKLAAPERLMKDDGKALFEVMRKGAPLGVEAYLKMHAEACKTGTGFLKEVAQ